jgi:predicted methyltransferase
MKLAATVAAAGAALYLAALQVGPKAAEHARVADALKDPRRPADQMSADAQRKPAAVIAFLGLKPGDRVADFMPGEAYFTRLFSDVVGDKGRVYAVLSAEMERHCKPEEFAGTHVVERDASYRNVRVSSLPVMKFATPERVDAVFTAQNYHDLHDEMNEGADVVAVNRAVFAALRPGGVYVVLDHVAEAGSGIRDTERLHRIDPAAIRREAEAAGFVFEGQNDVLRNPADDHATLVFDPSIRGRTDQVILKFRKPAGA